jgi:hypothetical protein
MAFDDRHTEFLVLAAVGGVATAISLPVLLFFGCEGWCLGMGVVGCIAVSYALILLALHHGSLFDWFKRKTKPKFAPPQTTPGCNVCGHPGRILWGCGTFPKLPDVDKGNYVILQRCEQCGALWCMSPYESYLSFTFLAAWPYGQHEWRIVHDLDNGSTLLEWHAAMIREHWQELADDERQHVERWRKRSYGHNPIDRRLLTKHPIPLQESSEIEAIVRAISEK